MSIVIRIAEEKDLLPIQRLVAKAGLVSTGIEKHIGDFLVVEDGNQEIVGTVGIERLGEEDGLLRSLVIKSESWNGKIGLEFLEITVAFAKQKGFKNLYLLTHRSLPFFEFLGFKIIPTPEIPEQIKQTTHFSQYVDGVTKLMICNLENIKEN